MSNSDKYAALNWLAKCPVNWPHHLSPTGSSPSSHCLIAQTTGREGSAGRSSGWLSPPHWVVRKGRGLGWVGNREPCWEQCGVGVGRNGLTQVRARVGLPGQAGRASRALSQQMWGFEGRTETQGNKLPPVPVCFCIWETKQKVYTFVSIGAISS